MNYPNYDRQLDGDLGAMFRRQLEFQQKLYGAHPKDFVPQEREDYVKVMILALTDELHEALGEISWKPWASGTFFNRDAYVGELIDAWHFLLNLFLIAGVTPEELTDRYFNKIAVNERRQDEGYTGTEKCTQCGRALDDLSTACTPNYCADYGART